MLHLIQCLNFSGFSGSVEYLNQMAERDLVSALTHLHLAETSAIHIDKVTDDYVLDLTAQCW